MNFAPFPPMPVLKLRHELLFLLQQQLLDGLMRAVLVYLVDCRQCYSPEQFLVHIIVYLRVFATLVSWMLRFLIDND
jgi:hypothetical protein